jgi:uncharacterized protein
MSHPNEDLFRKGYELFLGGDLTALMDLMADDVVWHVGGDNPLSGDYRGKDEVMGLFGQFFERSGGTLRIEIHDVLANDEHGVALTRTTAERDGKSIDTRSAHIVHFSDGKVVESWQFSEDTGAMDTFWR